MDTIIDISRNRCGLRTGFVASAIALALVYTAYAGTGGGGADQDEPFTVEYTAEFSEADLMFGEAAGYDKVTMREAVYVNVPGEPMLPAQLVRIALPPDMIVTGISVLDAQTVTLDGVYDLFPGQTPRPVSSASTVDDLMPPDAAAYSSTEAYPSKVAEFAYQTDLAGQNIAVVKLFPVQYIAAARTLQLQERIEIAVKGVGGNECGDYLPANLPAASRVAYERMIERMVVNPQDVGVNIAPNPPAAPTILEDGNYSYVIITDPSWVDDFQPLADWKNKKGSAAKIVTTNWIYDEGGYAGQAWDMIRAFVKDAHENWGTMYFLLGGDTNMVAYHTRTISGENIPNDTYYADFDDDWMCEVHVGRAPVRNAAQVETFVGKILSYEKTPPLTDYARTAVFMGFDLNREGSREGELCKGFIWGYYLPENFAYTKIYDCLSGPHKTKCMESLNQGNHLVNHIDHSGSDSMGAGYVNHDEMLSKTDMGALTNAGRQSILYSIGCWPCNYPKSTCIAESFVRNAGGGGVAFVGNSRSGWYSPFSADSLSLRYDQFFFRSLFEKGYYRLGECFSDHKNDGMAPGDLYDFIYTELTLLGDPEILVWTEDPAELTVSFNDKLIVGADTEFTVQVSGDGTPLPEATVCVMKDGEVYEVAQTGPTGTVQLDVQAASTGQMSVTVTCHNYLPLESEAEVIEPLPGDINSDAVVDVLDLLAILAAWGDCSGCPEDLDGDGTVGLEDILILAENWT